MKRQIKFRGKCANAWRKGDHLTYHNCECIKNWMGSFSFEYEAAMNTVGQFTGLYDIDFNEIYEGDICETVDIDSYRFRIAWDGANAKFSCFLSNDEEAPFALNYENARKYTRVIGNIYDNAELLKGE